ncbi:MAG: polyphosphate kinase 1 [Planctomycetota bacterium]
MGTAPVTPRDRVPIPEPESDGSHDLSRPDYFLNRELTWLNFNFRVLNEAEDHRTPLMERLKFVAIVGSNLDEFFMKRIGGLKQQVGAGVHDRTIDGRTPQEQIREANTLVRELERRKRDVLDEILRELRTHGIEFRTWSELSAEEQAELRMQYVDNIYPLVTPQATDPAHPFPFISNLSVNLLVTLRYRNASNVSIARVKVPLGGGVPRFLQLASRTIFVPLEEVMAHNLDLLFPGMSIESCEVFRVTRNANTERDEDTADDLLSLIETELRDRKFAPIVRMQVDTGMDPDHRGMLAAELGLDEDGDVFECIGMQGTASLWEIVGHRALRDLDLYDAPPHVVDHPVLDPERNIFHVLRDAGSVLLHHPYESFSTSVERFLREASRDPNVRAIKMILYRTSARSKIIQYLEDAARNGKQVAVVVELKARFDEEANIRWANRLEDVGIHVTYGVVGLKTHGKVILVVRQDFTGLRRYVHIGTGNYHADTARLYSDLGLFTADQQFGEDVTELVNYLTTGYKPTRRYNKLLVAPKHCKQGLLERIDREVASHSEESPGHIQFKTNALEDAAITRALYRAAAAGVKVDLVIRDTCRLRPGIPGLSENVTVVSVVGRFLEHSRIYYFRNGGEEEYFIGSADCMRRNLDSRVEVLAPVEDKAHQRRLRFMLDTQMADRRSAWQMRADGSYEQRVPTEPEEELGSQQVLMERAVKRSRKRNRLKRRKTRGFGRGYTRDL